MAVIEGNEQSLPGGSTPKHRSSFPESYREFTTMRFADITPSYIQDTVESGHYPLRSVSDVRSPSLKAPLMENISMKKFYAHVPKQCILPFNWDKIEVNPNQGDDVDFSKVGTSVANFPWKVAGLLKIFAGLVDAAVATTPAAPAAILQAMFRFMCLSQYFHSNGSLFAHLRMNLAKYGWYSVHFVSNTDYYTIVDADKFFDYWYAALVANVKSFVVSDSDGRRYTVYVDEEIYKNEQSIIRTGDMIYITFRMFWEMFMDAPYDYTVSSVYTLPNREVSYIIRDLSDDTKFSEIVQGYDTQQVIDNVPIDLGRLWAYQIACVQFFSNDHVDYIYNAELFRQNIFSIIINESDPISFLYNGVSIYYDYLSAAYSELFLNVNANIDNTLKYWCNLCSFRKSLRYMDYFTGARPRPLAMGDVDVDVNNNAVSVIDITKNIQIQKFLNAVNRSGRRLSKYVQELFGTNIGYDYHEPEYLAQTKDVVFGSEVENTAAAQQDEPFSVTSVLRGKSANFEFTFDCKRPGYLIGVTFFDIPRAYTRSIDRQVFAVDRFDLFNPYLQFIGDQQIYCAELGLGGLSAFGYKDRYNEYKERYNVASGGFVDNLPGFAFLADASNDEIVTNRKNISPSYIRSRSYELDRFYIQLSGFNWSNYFHFIVRNDNITTPTLPMVKHPTIL